MDQVITAVFAFAFAIIVAIAIFALGPAIANGSEIALPSFSDLNGGTILKWFGVALLIGIPIGMLFKLARGD